MNRLRNTFGGFFSFLALACSLQAVEVFRLENGLTVLVAPDHRLPLVHVTALYRVGSANESPGITGVAHYVEHMNFRATANVSQADITGFINRVGGRWNGYTSLEQTLYAATVPSWALEEIFRIEADRMARTRFEPADFERERTSVVAELQEYENDPGSPLWDLGVATAFEIHPYRYNIIGWLEDVLALPRDRAYRFYKDYYGPNNAILAVVGNTGVDEVRKLAARYFGPLPRAPLDPAVRVKEPPKRGEKRATLILPGANAQLLLLVPAPAADDPDFAVLMVMDALLAGGRDILSLPGTVPAGSSGLLAARLGDYGVIGVETALTPTRSPYLYGIRLHLKDDADVERLLSEFNEKLTSLLDSTTEEELEEARHRLLSYQVYASDELAEKAHRLAYFEGLGSWALADRLGQRIAEVGRSDLMAFPARWLQKRQRTVALLEPGDLGLQARSVPSAASSAEASSPRPAPVPDRALSGQPGPHLEVLSPPARSGPKLAAATLPGLSTTIIIRLGLGSRFDPPGREGLALLSAETLDRRPELWARLSRLGAVRTATDTTDPSSFREYRDLQITFLASDSERVVPILAAALAPPPITETLLAETRREIEERLQSLSREGGWRARREAVERLGPGSAPGWGTPRSRASLGVDEVRAFLAQHFQAGKVWAVSVGPEATGRGVELLEKVLANVPRGAGSRAGTPIIATSPATEPVLPLSAVRIPLPGKTQTEIFAALPVPGGNHSAHLALRMLNYILGETGYAGRLGRALVDRGLTYSVYAVLPAGKFPGIWTIETGASPANLEAVLTAVREEVSSLAAGEIEDWELREAKSYLLGSRLRQLESAPGQAALILDDLYLDRDPAAFAQKRAQILALTLAELQEAARTHLRPQALSMAAAGAVGAPE